MLENLEETRISLSLLEYERDLPRRPSQRTRSESFARILKLIDSGKLYSLHIDVMRPPLIPDRSAFPIELVKQVYQEFHEKIVLEIHLMVKEPDLLVQEISKFVQQKERRKTSMIIQCEAYGSEQEIVNTLGTIKGLGYRAGIGINLSTCFKSLTDQMIEISDLVLVMSVPMGKGGQEYSDQATERIRDISKRFPEKAIKVDGGINDRNTASVAKAGAKILVVGSFVTASRRPLDALKRLEKELTNPE